MPYSFENEEHAAIREQIRAWAAAEIRPEAHRWEEAGEFPVALYRRAAEVGLLGLGYPEALGGVGGDVTHALAGWEEVILAGHSVGTCVGLGTLGISVPPILGFGTEEQKERFVRPVFEGRSIAALAVTEPGGGSDVAALATRAVRDGDAYLVTGSKTFITSATRADLFTTAVRTGGAGHDGISMLLIERETPGLTVSPRFDKMGWWASDTAEVTFENCRVPVAHRIGEENGGFRISMANFAEERLLLASQCVAIAALALSEAVAYARERKAFGKSLSGFQVTRHKLAEMTTRLAASRALVAELAMNRREGVIPPPSLAAMPKNTATDMCTFVVDQAVQIHGGYGYMREFVVERLYRDARLYPIGGGTREIMNEGIARSEGF